jgi:AcrR family transcriptional regulator
MAPSARDRLIDAAFELFDEHGYDQTTVDEIAARAGVGRTTFFRLFRAKEDVIFPAHDALLEAASARLATATARTADVALTEATALVLEYYLAEDRRARIRYRLTNAVPSLRDREYASMRLYQRLFREFAQRWLPDTPAARLHAELLGNAVVTAHNHVLRRWLRGDTEAVREEFAEAMAEVLRRYAVGRGLDDGPSDAAGAGRDAADSAPAVLVVRTRKDLDRLLPELNRLLS